MTGVFLRANARDRQIVMQKYSKTGKKLKEMISQRFSVLLGVQNNMLKVDQNPLIKKLLN